MTKIKNVLFGVIGLYFFATLSLAHAEISGPDAPGAKMHSRQPIQEIFSQLNLTDDQKQQLEANKQQHRAKMESARQEMKIQKKAMQEALMNPQLDMVRINQIHEQIKALQDQMEDNKLSSILAVRSILTPEQFTRFVNLMRKHRQEHGD